MLLISTTVLFLGLYISSTTPIDTPNAPACAATKKNYCQGFNLAWVRRECLPGAQLTSWRDVCEGGYIYTSCPVTTVCENILDGLDDTIQCIPLLKENETQTRSTKEAPQIGTSSKKSGTSLGTNQLIHNVTIEDDMTASVTAMLLSKFLPLASKLVLTT